MKIASDAMQHVKSRMSAMRASRRAHWDMWRQIANVYLPYTVPWLLNSQKQERIQLNPNYISSVGLSALRTQTAGLMNGITSPTRPWFSINLGADESRLTWAERQWLHTVTGIMYNVLARSNFYQVSANMYFDLGLFGTSGMQMYSSREDVVSFQRFNVGEYYTCYDSMNNLYAYSRELRKPLNELVNDFGLDELPETWRELYRNPKSHNTMKTIYHFVERTSMGPDWNHAADKREWRELYYTTEGSEMHVLSVAGYNERPATFPRWSNELDMLNSPAFDALADMLELHQLLIKKGVGLEKMVDPPMAFDSSLKSQPKSTMPGGHVYIPNLQEAVGARPLYQVVVPIDQMRIDANELKASIREAHYNDLFKMITQLDTVRSATEIDARREEKLVLLAHFLERFEKEQLEAVVSRLFSICMRAGLFPDPPRTLANREIDIKFISILTTAQKAIATAPLERLFQMVGAIAGAAPEVLDIVNFDEFVYSYGADIGANPLVLRDREQLAQRRQQREEYNASIEASATASTAIQAGKTLADTETGGGRNMLQELLGN